MKTTILVLLTSALALNAQAGSATWNLNPSNGDWNTALNWTPNTVPNGPADTATFGVSNTTNVSLSAAAEVNSIVFGPGASAFTIACSSGAVRVLTISGAGIANNSEMRQQLVAEENEAALSYGLRFANSATAGTNTMLTAMPGVIEAYGTGGSILFDDQSSAGHSEIQVFGRYLRAFREGRLTFLANSTAADATITTLGTGVYVGTLNFVDESTAGNATINNGRIFAQGGFFYFWDTATAGTSQITNEGNIVFRDSASLDRATITNVPNSTNGIYTGSVNFWLTSTGGTGTIVNQGGTAAGMNGAGTHFLDSSTAGSATLIADAGNNGGGGGVISFAGQAIGGQARIEVFGNGSLDISARDQPGVAIGSLEGDGSVFLGANKLTIGGNGPSKTFSGVIQDGGVSQGTGGSLTKVGQETFQLSSANTYTGGTTVRAGALVVRNRSGSATGTGTVSVNAGTLGGSGIISGAVTIGSGSGTGAFLAPAAGTTKQTTLTIQSGLTLSSDATYTCTFKAKKNKARTDLVIAGGVTINGATVNLSGTTLGRMRTGLTLTVLSNTSANPISGTFSNLPDGGIVTVNGNNLQASYSGGDGNDLTLKVVP